MGSFNVGCGLSNLSIHEGDKAGIVLLLPNELRKYRAEGAMAYHSYPNDLFSIVGGPVFGTYDSYGRLENVKPSASTAHLEKVFGLPIETIMKCVGNNDFYSNYSNPWKKFSNVPNWDGADKYKGDDAKELELLGFFKESDISYSYHEVTITFSEKEVQGHTFRAYNVTDPTGATKIASSLSEALSVFTARGIYPGYPAELFEAFTVLSKTSQMFFLEDVYVKMGSFLESVEEPDWYGFIPYDVDKWATKYTEAKELNDARSTIGAMSKEQRIKLLLGLSSAEGNLSRTLTDTFNNPFNKDWVTQIIEMGPTTEVLDHGIRLYIIATHLNRMIAPTLTGMQDGDDDSNQELNRITDVILADRNERYETGL